MLHQRLKQAREDRGLTLQALASQIGVRPKLLELIEAGAFSDLPPGVYGRSSIRAYASAMGLNPDEAIAEVAPLLVRPEDPLDGLARVKGHRRRPSAVKEADEPAATPVVPAAAAAAVIPKGGAGTVERAEWLPSSVEPDGQGPRLTWASTRADWWRPVIASLVDGALLGVIELVLIWLTVLACGTGVVSTLKVAGPAMALLFVLFATMYFVLLGGVRNETLGTRVAGLRRAPSAGVRLDVRTVLLRARHCFTRQMPATVDWTAATDSLADKWRRVTRLRRV